LRREENGITKVVIGGGRAFARDKIGGGTTYDYG